MKVLVADDESISRRIFRAILTKHGYFVIEAVCGASALAILDSLDPPRLALLDWEMPNLSGPAVCAELRKRIDVPYTYTLLLTARDTKADAVAGLDAGADDYLTKPVDTRELLSRLRSGRRVLDLMAQLVSAREALKHQATHDPLTGALNRSGILDVLSTESARATREQRGLAVISFDIDHFKSVNDRYGHPTGDDVLCAFAERVRSVLRPYDSLGRVGGEEFLVVMPGPAASGAVSAAERLREAIAKEPFATRSGLIDVTASLGVDVWRAANGGSCDVRDTGDTIDQIVGRVDSALYESKRTGRNRVTLATPDSIGASARAHSIVLPAASARPPFVVDDAILSGR